MGRFEERKNNWDWKLRLKRERKKEENKEEKRVKCGESLVWKATQTYYNNQLSPSLSLSLSPPSSQNQPFFPNFSTIWTHSSQIYPNKQKGTSNSLNRFFDQLYIADQPIDQSIKINHVVFIVIWVGGGRWGLGLLQERRLPRG